MNKILVFDVNETLLDLSPLSPHFKRVFGDDAAMKQWFLMLLHSSLTVTLSNNYSDFSTLAGAALDSISEQKKISLKDKDRSAILDTIKNLPPHKEVPESLDRLRSNGFRLFTLTNSPPKTLQAQMKNSDLIEYFEDIFSVDETKKFKPAVETYESVAAKLGTKTNQIMMIAAHDWDIAGAVNAGCQTAYIAREGKTYNKTYKKPDISGEDLKEIADRLLEK